MENSMKDLQEIKNRTTRALQRGVGGWRNSVMVIKEGTYGDKHWMLYTFNELLNTASKTSMLVN